MNCENLFKSAIVTMSTYEPSFNDGRQIYESEWITILLTSIFRNEACGICELYGAHIAQVNFQIRKDNI